MKNRLSLIVCAIFLLAQIGFAQNNDLPIAKGKFLPTDESLKQYEFPEWFRDAKFGIWSHWGPPAPSGFQRSCRDRDGPCRPPRRG